MAPTAPSIRSSGARWQTSDAPASSHPWPIGVRANASRTVHASGRCAVSQRPLWRIGIPARGATSAQTSRDRIARRQVSPSPCPETVMNPKFLMDAPTHRSSRSITTTRQPRLAATSACASPTIPAPTTARSNMSPGMMRATVSRSRILARRLGFPTGGQDQGIPHRPVHAHGIP